MMDFTYADMKFRSHFNDDEEEEYVSQSFTRFRIKGTSNKYFFGNLIIRKNAKLNSREILQITKTRNKIAANLNTVAQ